MIANNKALFDEFKQIHDRYGLEGEKLQKEFNEIGAKVQNTIRQWEDKLCGRSEGSGYASFTGGLAQKFQDEVRKAFPFIDHVGIIIETVDETPAVSASQVINTAPLLATEEEELPLFNLKKIEL